MRRKGKATGIKEKGTRVKVIGTGVMPVREKARIKEGKRGGIKPPLFHGMVTMNKRVGFAYSVDVTLSGRKHALLVMYAEIRDKFFFFYPVVVKTLGCEIPL